MYIKRFVFNPLEENTYLVIDEKTKHCLIIDAGCLSTIEKQTFTDYIKNHELIVDRVLNTHLHLDHCFGNHFIKETFGVGPEAHKEDESLLNFMNAHAAIFGIECNEKPQALSGYLNEGDIITIGNSSFKVIHIPGHSKGSIAFYSESDNTLFSGDSLFKGGIGRTDLPRGSYSDLTRNLIQKIMILPDETEVYSGHGDVTTIGDERDSNPYI